MKYHHFFATHIGVRRRPSLPYIELPIPTNLTVEQQAAAAEIYAVAWPQWGDLEIKQGGYHG